MLLLLCLGLACKETSAPVPGTGTPAVPEVEPAPEAAATADPLAENRDAVARRAQCGPDEVAHRYYGPRPGALEGKPADSCPASPAALEWKMASAIGFFDHVDEPELERRAYAGFALEREEQGSLSTALVRGSFQPGGSMFAVTYCHYLGCARLDVADEGDRPSSWESCLPVLGGTKHPARAEPSCPAAVRIGGAHRAFVRKDAAEACCYSIAAPVAPSPKTSKKVAGD
jgi:hypothetical protein